MRTTRDSPYSCPSHPELETMTISGITEGNAAGAREHVDCLEIVNKDKGILR